MAAPTRRRRANTPECRLPARANTNKTHTTTTFLGGVPGFTHSHTPVLAGEVRLRVGARARLFPEKGESSCVSFHIFGRIFLSFITFAAHTHTDSYVDGGRDVELEVVGNVRKREHEREGQRMLLKSYDRKSIILEETRRAMF